MPQRTALFQLLPWTGGLNSSLDESVLPSNRLVAADNVTYDVTGAPRKRDGFAHNYDNLTSDSTLIVGLHDFWAGLSSRNQKRVAVKSDGRVYVDSGGVLTALTVSGTAWTGTITQCTMTTFNNRVIICVDGANNVVKYWDGNNANPVTDLPGTPPKASWCGQHQGRLILNDKTNVDSFQYSAVNDHTLWNGVGDSGGFPIAQGDGDPDGLNGFVSFKGIGFFGKRLKLYRMTGYAPEEWQIELVSDGIGFVNQNAIARVDQDDVFFVSTKGVHSLAATNNYGDFESTFVSSDIQRTFNNSFVKTRLKYVTAAYLNTVNSIAFAFTESSAASRLNTNNTTNNALYLFNVVLKQWYRWSDVSCQSVIVASDGDKRRFYLGTHYGRITKTLAGNTFDTKTDASHVPIKFRLETGWLWLDSNPYSYKALKRFILYYKPFGRHSLQVALQVDSNSQNVENSLSFSSTGSATALGVGFKLGSTKLGSTIAFNTQVRHVDGLGRGVKIVITQEDLNNEAEIQGLSIEYMSAGIRAG